MKHERFDSFMEQHAEIPAEDMTRYEQKLEKTFSQVRSRQAENSSKSFHYGMMATIAAVCALMFILVPPLFEDVFLFNWQQAHTEDDGEIYVIDGIVHKPDTGKEANAEGDSDDSDEMDHVNTDSYEEFCAFIGTEMVIPAVLLEKWNAELYYAIRNDAMLYIDVLYTNDDAQLSYSRTTFYSDVAYSNSINQDEEGETILIGGTEVYVYTNQGDYHAVWSTGRENHILGGEANYDELMELLKEFI